MTMLRGYQWDRAQQGRNLTISMMLEISGEQKFTLVHLFTTCQALSQGLYTCCLVQFLQH